MAHVVIVSGPPCSGKSRVVAHLCSRYAVVALEKDCVKEALFDALGMGGREWSRRLSNASFAVIFALARRAAAAGRSIVLEGNFSGERAAEVASLGGPGVELLHISCIAPLEVLRARQERRARKGGRHPGHLDAQLVSEVGTATPLRIDALTLTYDSTREDESALAPIFAALDPLLPPARQR